MPRQARISLSGELFHLTQRGNYRQRIFEDDQDRKYYLKLFEEYKDKFSLEVYAFCLMENHVHFIVKPLRLDSMAQTICRCHQRYAYYFHKKRTLNGHLWQERFYSCLLLGEHVRQAMKYVERNPVRANIVPLPEMYQWSSAREHYESTAQNKIMTLADGTEYMGGLNWKDFIGQSETDEEIHRIREKTLRGQAMGSPEQIEKWERILGRRLVPKPRGRPPVIN